MSEQQSPTTATAGPEHEVSTNDAVDAMRSIQTEHDRWHLAEVLAQLIPSGTKGFAELLDEATSAGVTAGLTQTTLRLYRDTANRWPEASRVPNVSFSAHREAMVLPSISEAAKMLTDLANNTGPGSVTVASVRKAIAIKNGRTPAQPKPSTKVSAEQMTMKAVIEDLAKASGAKLIEAIPATTGTRDLDQIHSGLKKVLTHVERLQAKAARKAQAAAKKTTPTETATAPRKRAPRKAAAQGDLRGL